jgi:Putative Ig domain
MTRHLLLLLPLILGAQPEATVHQEYRYQLPKPTLTWTPVTSLPSGLLIIPGASELWGAPNQAGQYNFALKASDGTQITLNLKVNALWNLSLTRRRQRWALHSPTIK